MANIARWTITTSYTALTFTAADLNSLPIGGGALSTSVVSNGTNLDLVADFSFAVTIGGTTTSTSRFDLYLLPLNQDGSTYGDGYASSTTAIPTGSYYKGFCTIRSGLTTGTVVNGTFEGIRLMARDFKVAFVNQCIALNATAALTLKIQTSDENLNS